MKGQRTIATKAELECLERLKQPIPGNGRRALLHRNRDLQTMLDLLFARVNEARDVIDEVARYFGIDPNESNYYVLPPEIGRRRHCASLQCAQYHAEQAVFREYTCLIIPNAWDYGGAPHHTEAKKNT